MIRFYVVGCIIIVNLIFIIVFFFLRIYNTMHYCDVCKDDYINTVVEIPENFLIRSNDYVCNYCIKTRLKPYFKSKYQKYQFDIFIHIDRDKEESTTIVKKVRQRC